MSDPDEEAAREERWNSDYLIKSAMQEFLDGNAEAGMHLVRQLGMADQNRMIFAAGLFVGTIYRVRGE